MRCAGARLAVRPIPQSVPNAIAVTLTSTVCCHVGMTATACHHAGMTATACHHAGMTATACYHARVTAIAPVILYPILGGSLVFFGG